jgi:hypothetical protein
VRRSGSLEKDGPLFGRGKDAPASGRKGTQFETTDARAKEPQGRVTDRGGHAADLAIAAFSEFERDP